MQTTVVVNPKGGSGKTTLITNLAGYYAHRGQLVFLQDDDRQQSSAYWLGQRPDHLPSIYEMASYRNLLKSGLPAHHIFIDTPAGTHGEKLKMYIKMADQLVVPIQPSGFDIDASRNFLKVLREMKRVRKNKTRIALVGMRVAPRTHSAADLEAFLNEEGFPVLSYVQETQTYIQMARTGYSLFDLIPSKQKKELPNWQPIMDWLQDVQ